MGVNHVELSNGETVMDLRGDTVAPETLMEGVTAHDASGEPIVGTYKPVQADLSQTDPNQPDYVKGQHIIDRKIQNYAIPEDDKGIPYGVATLDEDGHIPADQLPSVISGDCVYVGATAPASSTYTLWVDTSSASPVLKYKNSLGAWAVISGGGSGGSNNNAKLSVTNKSGWLAKTISYGADCNILLEWSSIEDEIETGNGTVTILIDGVVKSVYEEEQGEIVIPVNKYLTIGTTKITVVISDLYGNPRELNFSITCVKAEIKSYFDASTAFTGDILYSYEASGSYEKTVHFEIDGEEIGTEVVSSNREQGYYIEAQYLSHGSHKLEVYFSCYIDNQYVESNRLVYDLIYYEEGNDEPIIACAFKTEAVKQFATVPVQWIAYTPNKLTTEVSITDNFGFSTSQTVNRTVQSLSYKADNVGDIEIVFTVNRTPKKIITFRTEENKIHAKAETSNLELYLKSVGRSNNDNDINPREWSYNDIEAELTGFNLVNDGWQPDNDGDTVLRVTGDARVEIPFKIFANDFRTNGKTIEFEFATRDVLNYDSTIISCWSDKDNRGIKITAQKATLKSEKSEISTQYKENEHIRVAFCVEKRAKHRLLSMYLNGVLSGVKQYADNDDFSQAEAQNIFIGSNDCTVDLYCIRVYNNDLTRYQILDNWIADTQNILKLLERDERNNIYNEDDQITIETIPANVPYLVLQCPKLPQSADDEFDCSGYYVDPLHPRKSYTFSGATVEKQGTSSMAYRIGNLKIKYSEFIIDGVKHSTYKMRDNSIGTATFTYKADVASIEGANNLQLVRLFNDITPAKTPPQLKDSRVRQGIDGLPIVIFHDDGNAIKFIGKYNFNNDKSTREVYGFKPGDECWSFEVNGSDRVLYKNDDFSDDSWKKDIESRYPKDYYDCTRLKAMISWVKSTDREAPTNEPLPETVLYPEGEFTHDTKEYRFAKFKNDAHTVFDVESLKFFYMYTTFHLMVDNWAKNTFPTYFADADRWFMLPYDFDTALGINNEGHLVIDYNLQDTDTLEGGGFVFNGQNSVLMNNTRDCFADEIKDLYKKLRSEGKLTYEDTINRFQTHQNVWGEAIFNEDMQIKHLDDLIENNNAEYLPMALGKKELQLMHWLYNRYRFMDSYYVAGDSLTDKITFRSWGMGDIVMTPYADIYTTVEWGSAQITQDRTKRGTSAAHKCPLLISVLNDTEINIYSASQLSDLGDLSPLKIGGFNDFSCATKIQNLKIGDGGDYRNGNLKYLSLGNNRLLRVLDVRNCFNLTESVDLRGCTNLEYAYFEGTATTGVDLPDGGILKELSLPSTVTGLTITNQPLLTKFTMPSYENLTTLRLENLNVDLFDTLSMVLQMPKNARVRVLGVEWNIATPDEIFIAFEALKKYRGLDEYGNNVDNAQISGVIHTGTVTGDQLDDMKEDYPYFYHNFTIDYEHLTCWVKFYNYEGTLLHTAYVEDSSNCYEPTEELIDAPTKPETDESKFIFAGWDKSLENVSENRSVTAIYDEHKKHYISFIDNFGNAVKVNENDTNVYYDIEGENVISIPANLPNYSIVDGEGATWDYHFEGWSLDGQNVIDVPAVVSGTDYHITYQAVFSEHRVNVVKFMNDTVVHSELHLYEGGNIIAPETPARVSTYQFDYEFAGWTIDGENIVDVAETIGSEDITYIAKYTAIDRYYSIKFVDWNGSVLKQYSVKHDEKPTCDNPTREATAQYFYDFDGWTPEIVAVTGDAVYTATYLATLRTYTVKWLNEDGTSLLEEDVNVPYGTMPSYDGATPTKQGNAQYSYTFAGWHIAISEVKGDIVYKATYTAEVNKYTVTWKNHNGTVLETDTKVPYGDMPEYNGSTPTKTATAQYTYAFAGWDTAVSEVTGDVVYTAIFTQHIRSYTIKFVDYNGSVLKSETLEYGSMPTAPTPTRTGYDFTGWDSSITTVSGDKTYTAKYTVKMYTITWKFGSQTKTTQCAYGSTPTPPSGFEVGSSYSADGYTYTLKSWNVSTVTGNATYTATVSGSGSITSRFSKFGRRGLSSTVSGWDAFLAGTGVVSSLTSTFGGFLYGFDFSEFATLTNVNITDIKVSIGSTKSFSGGSVKVTACTGFETSGNTSPSSTLYKTYDVTNDTLLTLNYGSTSTETTTAKSFKEDTNTALAIDWANANIDKLISGYDSNSFGLWFWVDDVYLAHIHLTIDFTFG